LLVKTVREPRIVYKDKIIYVERPLKTGCYVNWQTGKAYASVDKGENIECILDHKRQHVDTRIWGGEINARKK